jgi:hypothetical protein
MLEFQDIFANELTQTVFIWMSTALVIAFAVAAMVAIKMEANAQRQHVRLLNEPDQRPVAALPTSGRELPVAST